MSHDNPFAEIEKLEADLWKSADDLRANSKLTSSEYAMPVLGLIFLRHATNRYMQAKRDIEQAQASGTMPKRPIKPADYIKRGSLPMPDSALYDTLAALPQEVDLNDKVNSAMKDIEAAFTPLDGQLPKDYGIFEKDVLERLIRIFNSERLKRASGDVFGRIYEYFLMKFSIDKAMDNGEFFTPPSLVQLIVNVIEPDHGTIFDPACGSGGMFVQSQYFMQNQGTDATGRVTFYGQEKTASTIRLAKMNLATHGLEGHIVEANTFYQDVHNLVGKCDFVMANPPFNVDMVDAVQTKTDKTRLPFGIPGENKEKKVPNANYLWISYFHSYLNAKGRAGFVMSSQASAAGNKEKEVRQRLITQGRSVDIMIAIGPKFFYTRGVPCELWFLDRNKPIEHADKVLMIDARPIFRKVTRRIHDFSAEQHRNIVAIVWLYRGQAERYLGLVADHCDDTLRAAADCQETKTEDEDGAQTLHPLAEFARSMVAIQDELAPFLKTLPKDAAAHEPATELKEALAAFNTDVDAFTSEHAKQAKAFDKAPRTNAALKKTIEDLEPLAEQSRDLVKQADLIYKIACRLIDAALAEENAAESELILRRVIFRKRKDADEARQTLVTLLKRVRYHHKHGRWLTERFPDAKLCNVEGLVKLVDHATLEANDWSLTPGRYVGVAPEEEDEDFDFEEVLRDIHIELRDLNTEAAELAAKIQKNFEELGV
jgi:type I restriction enzyme M protein